MLEDIDGADPDQIVMLHACAHNPTGCDPTPDEWKQIADVVIRKGHMAGFDNAY